MIYIINFFLKLISDNTNIIKKKIIKMGLGKNTYDFILININTILDKILEIATIINLKLIKVNDSVATTKNDLYNQEIDLRNLELDLEILIHKMKNKN